MNRPVHQTTATTTSPAAAPVIFLELPWVLVTGPLQLQQLGLVPILLKLRMARGDAQLLKPVCAGLVREKVRLNLRRLHTQFAPSYVIVSHIAGRMELEHMVCLLRFAGLDFVADNLHPEWRAEPDQSEARTCQITQWLAAHPELQSRFVILDSVEMGADVPRSALAGHAVMCPPTRGLTTPALDRARMLLRRAATADGLGVARDANAESNSVPRLTMPNTAT